MGDGNQTVVRDPRLSESGLQRHIDDIEKAVARLLVNFGETPAESKWLDRLSGHRVRLVRQRYCIGAGLDELAAELSLIAAASIENQDVYTISCTVDDFGPLLRLFGLDDLAAQFAALSEHRKWSRLVDLVLGAERALDRSNYGALSGDGGHSDRRMALVEELLNDNTRSDLLVDYVNDWYELERDGEPRRDPADMGPGSYTGYWCFEAAALAVVLDVDDSELEDHPHYPFDLAQYGRTQSEFVHEF